MGSLFILFHLNRELTSTQLDCYGRVLGTVIFDRPFFMSELFAFAATHLMHQVLFLSSFTNRENICHIVYQGLRIPVC